MSADTQMYWIEWVISWKVWYLYRYKSWPYRYFIFWKIWETKLLPLKLLVANKTNYFKFDTKKKKCGKQKLSEKSEIKCYKVRTVFPQSSHQYPKLKEPCRTMQMTKKAVGRHWNKDPNIQECKLQSRRFLTNQQEWSGMQVGGKTPVKSCSRASFSGSPKKLGYTENRKMVSV